MEDTQTDMTENTEDQAAPEVEVKASEATDMPDNKAVNTNHMTTNELAIFKRIAGQSDDWKTIQEKDIDDYSLRQDPFMLPDSIKQLEQAKEFKFRWVQRTIERLDEVRAAPVPHRWWIVNRDTFPQINPDLFDPVLGCIVLHDQMLVFKPYWMFEKRQALVADITDAQDRSSIERMGSENRDGVNISGGKKSPDQVHSLPGEIKHNDQLFQNPNDPDNTLQPSATDFSDLIDEQEDRVIY